VRPGERAEQLIDELCITSTSDLDLEAIAYDQGIEVRYEPLNGCEATLVGYGHKAIATVRKSSSRGRERFSIAHETGHWLLHRGRSFRCRADDIVQNYNSEAVLEKEADEFASHLLMPTSILRPIVKAIAKPTLKDVQIIADDFNVSLQAMSIRLVALDTLPVVIACYTKAGLKWHSKANHIPSGWHLKRSLDDESFAYGILNGRTDGNKSGLQSADTWFENDDADEFNLQESAMPSTNGHVLVLLYLTDAKMFERGYAIKRR
jgi:hypothetical protein